MIRIAIIDDHEIVSEGIESLLSNASDIEITAKVQDVSGLLDVLKTSLVHIALFNIYSPSEEVIQMLKQVRALYPKVSLLILSMTSKESFILKTLKIGAKGHLTKETSRAEIIEAIYSIRGGYDYYGKSITNVILRGYLNKSHEDDDNNPNKNQLSNREIEVLKLFGEGLTNKEIADRLFISIRTVESHKSNIMKKINLRTTVDLVKFAIQNNFMEV